MVVPADNAREAAVVRGLKVYGFGHLSEVADFLDRPQLYQPLELDGIAELVSSDLNVADLRDVKGQAHARRALEIAAAGGHNLIFVGPPGSGKTMLARRLPGILPPLAFAEALEVTQIHSVAGLLKHNKGSLVTSRPFAVPITLLLALPWWGGPSHLPSREGIKGSAETWSGKIDRGSRNSGVWRENG